MTKLCIRKITVGRELFRFESKQDWVDRGRLLYATSGYGLADTIALDRLGYVVLSGNEFRRAEEAGTYPVSVYLVDPTAKPNPDLVAAGEAREHELVALEEVVAKLEIDDVADLLVAGETKQKGLLLKRFHVDAKCTLEFLGKPCGARAFIVEEDWDDFDFGSGTGYAYALSRCEAGHERGHDDAGNSAPQWHLFYRPPGGGT